MNAPRWRRAIALVADVCVIGLPGLLMLAGWASVVQGTVQAGFGALAFYGTPLLLFTCIGVTWMWWMWRAHRGTLPVRSVGLVVGGLQYADGALTRTVQPVTVRGLALSIGATAMATLSALVMGFAVFQTAAFVWFSVTGR